MEKQSITGIIRTPIVGGKLILGGLLPNSFGTWLNNEFGAVHTLVIENKPWFMAIEIARILEYKNTRDAIYQHVVTHDKRLINTNTVVVHDGIRRGNPNRVFINEVGLYSLIKNSQMPKAVEFMYWIVSEVIPAIKTYGMYMTPEAAEKVIENPEIAREAAHQLQKAHKRIQELEPLAKYTQDVLQSDEALTVSMVAKEFGLTGFKLNRILKNRGVIFQFGNKHKKSWHVKDKYVKKKWFMYQTPKYKDSVGRIHTSTHLYLTQKGRQALHQLLPQWGYPIIQA